MEGCCAGACVRNELTEARKNQAFSSSPRVLEQFPELGRPPLLSQDLDIVPPAQKHSAILSSPRMLEEYPALKLGLTPVKTKRVDATRSEPGK